MEVERRLSRASFHCATLAQKCIDVLSRFPAAPKDMAMLPLELEARVNIAAMTSNPFMKGDDLVAALDDLTTAAALEAAGPRRGHYRMRRALPPPVVAPC